MGVIGERKDPYTPGVVDDGFDIIEQTVEEEQVQAPVHPSPRRVPRSRPIEIQGDQFSPRKLGVRHRRRVENLNFLMSLVEPEEVELLRPSLRDSWEESTSPLTELFLDREKMKIWNNFISCTEEEQEAILRGSLKAPAAVCKLTTEQAQAMEKDHDLSHDWDVVEKDDERTVHPAFAAEVRYRRIDAKLRTALKKRHVPLGMLENLENEVTSFFSEWPNSVLISRLTSSYERLLLHALCQYLDLHSHSFGNQELAKRRTQVENPHNVFVAPTMPLSKFIEKQKAAH